VPITSINTTDDETGARLTPDELSIYFASTRDSSFDLFRASRTSLSAPFGTAVKIASLSGPQADRSPSVKADEQVLMFDSDREGGAGGRDLYLGVRSSVSTSFGAIFNLGALNTSGDDSRPYMLPSGLVAYFESDTSGGGDIYRASRTSLADSFGTPVLVSQVNTSSAEDGYPIASEDESVVYFGTTRSGGAGGWDIMVSTRSSPGGTLSAPVRVSELATADDDIPTWISPDLCRLYVMRAPPSGTYDILVATRTP
jgi:Tol biopolymer transport system component